MSALSPARTRRQPTADFYQADLSFGAWMALWHQVRLVLGLQPRAVLEVGVGAGGLAELLARRCGRLVTLDLEGSLRPEVVGDVTRLPFADGSFDLVAAFEVLEHVPFEEALAGLREIRRVSRRHAVISTPCCCWYLSLGIQPFYAVALGPLFSLLGFRPFEPRLFTLKLPLFFLSGAGLHPSHYWEMGRRGYSRDRVEREIARAGWRILGAEDQWFHPYHRFYALEKEEPGR